LDSLGNVYVTGTSFGDYATIKYNSNGIQQWVAFYNSGFGGGSAASLEVDGSGNVYVTGNSVGSGSNSDYTTIKYDSNGNELWVARYTGSGSFADRPSALAIDSSGYIYVTGITSQGAFDPTGNYATVKYDSNGNELWVVVYDGPANAGDGATEISVDSSGNIYVTGYSTGLGSSYDYATIKYDSNGNQLWVARYNGSGNYIDSPHALEVDNFGNVYVTGESRVGGLGTTTDFATIKYDSNGNQLWEARYNGPNSSWDIPADLALDNSGNVYVTGQAATGSGYFEDTATVKYGPNGNQVWVVLYNGPPGDQIDRPAALFVDDSNNVYVTGLSQMSPATTPPWPMDFFTVKYSKQLPSTDLSVTKADSPDPVLVGQNLTYTVTLTNNGPDDAPGVILSDLLSGGVLFDSWTASQGSCSELGGTVTCNLGTLLNGAIATVTIVVTPTAPGTISNTASVASSGTDPFLPNNSWVELTAVNPPLADLIISKTDSPDPVLAGQNLTYTISVTNNGPSTATLVTVTDTLPGGVTYVSTSPSQGNCSGTSTVTCDIGSLANGANATITIVVVPTTTGILSNTASVSGNEADPVSGNNSATEQTTVNPASTDLSITKSDSPDPVLVGQNLTYTISVTNNGPSTATQVTVTDTLPPGAIFISASGSGWICGQVGGVVTCTRATLAVSTAPVITITVTPTSTGTISNTACVSGNEPDPNPGNDCSTANTTVNSNPNSADLSITKTDVPDPVERRADLTYTMVVTNNGSLNATGVTLTDTLPSGITIRSMSTTQGSCSSSGSVVTCNLGAMENGSSATVTIVVRSNSTGTLTNTASVTGNQSDSNSGNNSITVTTTVVTSAADLSVTKTDSPDPVTVGNSLSYTIVVTNNGPSRADGVMLTDTLPGGVTYVNAWSTRGTCSEAGGTVTCNIGRMRDGRSETVTIVVTPTGTGTLTNTASVTSSEADPVPGNNSATETTTVNAPSNNTPAGSNVSVPLGNGVSVTFSNVSTAGQTTIDITTTGSPPPTSFRLGKQNIYYDVNTTAVFSGPMTICFIYDDTQFSREDKLKLFHFEGSNWTDVTDSLDTNTNMICAVTTSLSPFVVVEPDIDDLGNISTRGSVLTGASVMIGGFIIEGTVPKTVLVRAQGPSLVDFGVTGVMSNPTMQLYSGSTVIAQNNNWQTTDPLCLSPVEYCGDSGDIIATGFDPCTAATTGCTLDSAIYVTLPPGPYTAIVSGVGGGTGVGLVGVFDVDTSGALSYLGNISTRGFVGTSANVQIGGFIIEGTVPKTVLVRAQGPSLVDFGVTGALPNPTMTLYSGATPIAVNNNWQDPVTQCDSPAISCGDDQDIIATGLDPCTAATTGCTLDSAIYVTLPPGAYTAIVSGVGGSIGVGLVGVFEVP
jgi:uncharacterized repeat protein (TIGR01451 family)